MLMSVWWWVSSLFVRDTRDIFRFFDGRRWRGIDPFVAARVLFTHPKFDWDETLLLLTMPRVGPQLQTMETIVAAVQEAFGVRSFDEGGLAETECLALLYEFREYMGDLKKNGSLFPISPPATESRPSVATPPIGEPPLTSVASDSGSMPSGSSSDTLGPSAKELSPHIMETPWPSAAPSTSPTNAVI